MEFVQKILLSSMSFVMLDSLTASLTLDLLHKNVRHSAGFLPQHHGQGHVPTSQQFARAIGTIQAQGIQTSKYIQHSWRAADQARELSKKDAHGGCRLHDFFYYSVCAFNQCTYHK